MKIFLIGFMGCGKSHWGRLMSGKMKLPFFDLDEEIAKDQGRTINELFEHFGEEYFRNIEKTVLFRLTESNESFIMATGGGTPCFFNNIDYLNQHGITVWLNCSVNCLHKRLAVEKEQRPLLKDFDDDQLHAYISKRYASRKIYYQQAKVIMKEEDLQLEKLVARIFQE